METSIPPPDPDLMTRWKNAGARVTRNDRGEVTGLDLSRTLIVNPGPVHLKTLPALPGIVVLASFTKPGLVHFKGLNQLQTLDTGTWTHSVPPHTAPPASLPVAS